jgi:WD40 repeat protein
MKMLAPDDQSVLFYEDGVLVFRDLLTHEVNNTIDVKRYRLQAFHTCFSPDGKLMLITAHDTPPLLLDVATGALVQTIVIPELRWAIWGQFASDGQSVFVGGPYDTIYRWDIPTRAVTQRYDDKEQGFIRFAITPDLRWLVGGGGWCEAGIWDVASGAKLHKLPSKVSSPQLGTVLILPDQQHALICEFTGGMIVHVASEQVVHELDQHSDNPLIDDAAAARRANLLITNANNTTTAAQLWDATTWRHLGLLQFDQPQKNMYPNCVDITADGRYAVTFPVMGDTLFVWDVRNRTLLRSAPADYYFIEGG